MLKQTEYNDWTPEEIARSCLHSDCTSWAYARGLCYYHYRVANRMVRQGLANWADLAARGKCTMPKIRGKNAIRLKAERWFMDLPEEL